MTLNILRHSEVLKRPKNLFTQYFAKITSNKMLKLFDFVQHRIKSTDVTILEKMNLHHKNKPYVPPKAIDKGNRLFYSFV